MSSLIDLTGKQFGEWTVLEKAQKKRPGSGNSFWVCQCSCGTIKEICGTDLRKGKTLKCRSHFAKNKNPKIEKAKKFGPLGSTIKDETGNRYFKLTVQSFAYTKNGKAYWNCLCDCGKTTGVSGNALRNGDIKSCGCLKSYYEEVIANFLKQNGYKFTREYKFSDLKDKTYLRFDFCILNNQNEPIFLIEYNGNQHYTPPEKFNHYGLLQKHDLMKIEYCKKNNIPILILNKNNFSLEYLKNSISCLKDN